MQDFINGLPIAAVILLLLAGFAILVKGADLFVEGSSSIARKLKVPTIIIGLTIVSMGTSLPDLVTSLHAAIKHEEDLAFRNAVGSNIFNILMVLGISATISPVALLRENIIDIIILMIFTVLVWLFAGTKRKISRKEGIIMALTYLVYCGYIIIR